MISFRLLNYSHPVIPGRPASNFPVQTIYTQSDTHISGEVKCTSVCVYVGMSFGPCVCVFGARTQSDPIHGHCICIKCKLQSCLQNGGRQIVDTIGQVSQYLCVSERVDILLVTMNIYTNHPPPANKLGQILGTNRSWKFLPFC